MVFTLARCLERLYKNYLGSNTNSLRAGNFEIAFKLFLITTTLASEYLNRYEKLNDLIEQECFLKDPLLILLGDMFLDIQEIDKKKEGFSAIFQFKIFPGEIFFLLLYD